MGVLTGPQRQISNVLSFCNQETLVRNGVSLAQLARAGADDNRALATIADKTWKDSRTVRITTIIAIIYLPANLVTVRDHPQACAIHISLANLKVTNL